MWSYSTNCVQEDANSIFDMQNNARKITYRTLRRAIGGATVDEWASNMGYATSFKKGLRLKNDGYVRFYKSKWKSEPCYYITHSAIEYIFVEVNK